MTTARSATIRDSEEHGDLPVPTFKANVDLDGTPGGGYADIAINGRFRDKSELRDWIVACTLRLMDDIQAEEDARQEAAPVG